MVKVHENAMNKCIENLRNGTPTTIQPKINITEEDFFKLIINNE
jgi:hypothetical protein